MTLVDMNQLNRRQLNEAAQILTDSLPLGWPDFNGAMEELQSLLVSENTMLAAIENDAVIGWGGILPTYGGRVFELHPLAVKADIRRMGVGTALMAALESAARARGGLTLWIGADDERPGGETSFANADLYDNLPERITAFDPGTHQTAFYMKLGYIIAGVLPDANGIGKPDIFLAKRL